MANSNLLSNIWEDYDRSSDLLQSAIQKLTQTSQQRISDRYGLSEEFSQQEITEDLAMALCERAMGTLAECYPQALENFEKASDPLDALKWLEEAETTWQSEAKLIAHFDADGQETAFLSQVREQSLEVMQRKLDEAADACRQNDSDENIALCVGSLAVMDQIMGELGHPQDSLTRQNLRHTVQSFLKK